MRRWVIALAALLLGGCDHLQHSGLTPPAAFRHIPPEQIIVLTVGGPSEIGENDMTGYRIGIGQNDIIQYEAGNRKGTTLGNYSSVHWLFQHVDLELPLAKLRTGPCNNSQFSTPAHLRVGNDVSPDLRCVDYKQASGILSDLWSITYTLRHCLRKYGDDELFYLSMRCSEPGKETNIFDPQHNGVVTHRLPWKLPSPMPEN